MKKLTYSFAILFILLSCNTKPKEQKEIVDYDPTLSYSTPADDLENLSDEQKKEREAVSKSVELNYILFDMLESRSSENQHAKGRIMQSHLDKEKFDYKQATKLSPFITYDTLQHQKVNGEFTLTFLNGDSLTFHDIPEEYGDALTNYTYIGRVEKLKKHIVEVMFWEDYTYLLIDQNDGGIQTIESVPKFNHDGTAMLTYDDSPYDDFTSYHIYNSKNGILNATHRLVTDHHYYLENFYWKNDSTVNIKATSSVNEDTVYYKLTVDQYKRYK